MSSARSSARCQTLPRSNWMVIPSGEKAAPSFQFDAQILPHQSMWARDASPASSTMFNSQPFCVT